MIAAVTVVLAGLLQAASLAWPFQQGIAGWLQQGQPSGALQLLAQFMLAWVVYNNRSVKQVFALTSLFATAWFCGTFWWLYISMHVYGGLAAWMAALAVFALAAALALYYALGMMTLAYYRLSGAAWALVFASVWTLAELMRGQWLTGFPWGAIGYAHVDSGLQVWAPWVGVYGVGWVAACLCAAFACWLKGMLRPKSRPVGSSRGVPVLVLVLGLGSAALTLLVQTAWGQWGSTSGVLSVTLLQGNIAQNEKFDKEAGVPQALQWYAQAIAQAKGQLIVAPETAIALLPQQLPTDYLPQVVRSLQTPDAPAKALLIGTPWGDPLSGYTNAVMALDGQSGPLDWATLYRYDKHHLVPFGEFIPPFFRWFTRMMNIPLGDFNRGGLDQAPLDKFGQKLAPNVCYEDLFGEELAVRFRVAERAPTVMVNLSNIGWFGDSVAIDQHLQISRMRTLELQRPMIRATNTGASAVIDHKGAVVWSLPRLQKAQATGAVEGRTGTITPYTAWVSNWGLLPLWALCLVLTVWFCQPLKRRASNHGGSL